MKTLVERFWAKVEMSAPADCWLWTASTMGAGYGQFTVNGKGVYAHRFAYELLVGPIPEGLTIDHLCRTRLCVNPQHMEPVTQGVNVLRGQAVSSINARKTHCLRGHPLAGDNIVWNPGRYGPTRQCRICKNVAQNRRYAARTARLKETA